jgi:hypothetical protein
MTKFYCLRFETSPTWRIRSPYVYHPGTGWPVILPGTGFPLRCLLRLAGLRWRYSTPPPHGVIRKSKSNLLYDWQFTANQFVLASNPWDSRPEFFQLNLCGNSPYVTSSLTRRWVCLSSSVRIALTARYWQFFLLRYSYIQVLCQYGLCKAVHAYLTYLMLQRQLSHLNGRNPNHRQVQASYIWTPARTQIGYINQAQQKLSKRVKTNIKTIRNSTHMSKTWRQK